MEEDNQEVIIRGTSKSPGVVILVIVGLIFLFYWFVMRPGQIKQECYNYAYGTPNNGNTQEWVAATKYYYEACLKSKGI